MLSNGEVASTTPLKPGGVEVCEPLDVFIQRAVWNRKALIQIHILFTVLFGLVFALCTLLLVMAKYPFKTVEFIGTPPITILNPGKTVSLGGVVKMRIRYHKHTDAPGLIVRTLARKYSKGYELRVLSSSTVVSNRTAGEGVTEASYYVGDNEEVVGENNVIVFTIYYTLYGFIPRMVQYESEPFDIVLPSNQRSSYPRKNTSSMPPKVLLYRAGLTAY